MTTDELMNSPVGVVIMASLEVNPELEKTTPAIAFELKKWADANGYTVEAIFCAVANWMGMGCSNIPPDTMN
jgi:hypothetical protein